MKRPKKSVFILSLGILLWATVGDNSFAQLPVQKAVMIIASSNFRDEELLLPKNALESNRIQVVLASSSLKPARGMLGTVVKPDILIKEIKAADYDALILVGGSGAEEYWDDAAVHQLLLTAMQENKILAAICFAPITLARAGLLKQKKATVWPGLAAELEQAQAEYTGNDLEVDGNIITAAGPKQVAEFAEALVKALVRRR